MKTKRKNYFPRSIIFLALLLFTGLLGVVNFSRAAEKLTVGDDVWFFEKKEEGVRICGAGKKGCVRTKVYLHKAVIRKVGGSHASIEPTKRYIFSYSPEVEGFDDNTWECAINVRKYCYEEVDFEGGWFSSGKYEEGEEHQAAKDNLVSGDTHIIKAVAGYYLNGNVGDVGVEAGVEEGPEAASEMQAGEEFYYPFKVFELEKGKHYLVNYFIGEAVENSVDGKVKVKFKSKFPHAYNPGESGVERGYESWQKRDCLHCYDDESRPFSRFTDGNYYTLHTNYELEKEYELPLSDIYKREGLSQERFVEKLVAGEFWSSNSDEFSREGEEAAREFRERMEAKYGETEDACLDPGATEGISGSPFTFKGSLVPCGRNCDDPQTPYNESASCTLCHLLLLLKRLFDLVFALLIIVSIVFVTVSGLMYMFSGVNPGLKSTAKGTLTKTLTGFGISMLSWLIVYTVLVFISADTDEIGGFTKSNDSWFQFTCKADSVFDWYKNTSPGSYSVPGGGPSGGTGSGHVGGKHLGKFPAPPSDYQSDWPAPDTSTGIDSYIYQSGIRGQISKGDASEQLTSFIECMSDKLPKRAKVISSVSDNHGMDNCTINNYSSGCAHKKGSCHYGGKKCVGKSYAVDMAEEQYGDIINYAAIKCNSGAFVWGEGNHVHVSIGGANGCGCN